MTLCTKRVQDLLFFFLAKSSWTSVRILLLIHMQCNAKSPSKIEKLKYNLKQNNNGFIYCTKKLWNTCNRGCIVHLYNTKAVKQLFYNVYVYWYAVLIFLIISAMFLQIKQYLEYVLKTKHTGKNVNGRIPPPPGRFITNT